METWYKVGHFGNKIDQVMVTKETKHCVFIKASKDKPLNMLNNLQEAKDDSEI